MIHTFQIHLDTAHSNHNLVAVLAANLLAAPAEVVVVTELENVGHEVVALDDKVFNHLEGLVWMIGEKLPGASKGILRVELTASTVGSDTSIRGMGT